MVASFSVVASFSEALGSIWLQGCNICQCMLAASVDLADVAVPLASLQSAGER